jgi:hypothetical protein
MAPSPALVPARVLPIAILILGSAAGCYPHSQAYRGAFSGAVVDPEGHPVPGATVVVCTSDESKSFEGCPHRAEAWTDPEGRFQFFPVKERQWCCFGASPLPPTHLTACGRDVRGRFLQAASVTVDASGATEPRISVAPSSDPSPQAACAAPK